MTNDACIYTIIFYFEQFECHFVYFARCLTINLLILHLFLVFQISIIIIYTRICLINISHVEINRM